MGDSVGISDLDAIWEAYEAAAYGELDRTPATVAGYRTHWRQFQAFVTSGSLASAAVLEATVRYREDLRRQRLATNTIYARLSGLKAVWRWAFDVGLVDEDPLRRFRLPRKVNHPRDAIDKDAYEELLGRLPQLEPVPRVIIALAAYAGLRAGEIRNLNVEDLNHEARSVTVRQGKGRKDRVVRMHPDLAALLRVTRFGPPTSIADRIRTLCARNSFSLTAAAEHLGLNAKRLRIIVAGGGMHLATAKVLARWDREWPAEWWTSQAGSRRFAQQPGRPLIVGKYGGRIAGNAVYKTVTSYIDACPHRFRTTWITVLLEHRVPIQIVADEAGHVALDTTRAYIGRRDQAAREQMDHVRFGPPQVAPEPPAQSALDRTTQQDDDEASTADIRDFQANLANGWQAVLERNPWIPGLVMSGQIPHRDWLTLEREITYELMAYGADPDLVLELKGHEATLADFSAITEFMANGCDGPPLSVGSTSQLRRSPSAHLQVLLGPRHSRPAWALQAEAELASVIPPESGLWLTS
jgi:integrase